MSQNPEPVRRSTTPWITSAALLGIAATTAWITYRRLHGQPLPSVGDLLDAADRAAKKLEDRVSDFAIAS